MVILKAASSSKPNALAVAIAGSIRDDNTAEIMAIGAGAINQAIKAIAIARGFVAPGGADLVCTPSFNMIEVDGNEKTAIRLVVDLRKKA